MTEKHPPDYVTVNRSNWNERARLHARDVTGSYQVEAFKQGASSLHAIEAGEIGDVGGKRLAHLQCHFGMDTLSLGRLGAEVSGLDLSPVAIAEARALAAATGIKASFVEGDVYDARRLLAGSFDIVYVTWGAIYWLPDIARWAGVVASLLAPGGFLYLLETHPAAMVLDQVDNRLEPRFAWRTPADDPILAEDSISYTGDVMAPEARRCLEWMHPLSDIINGLTAAGLSIAWLHEHEEIAYRLYPMLVPSRPKLYRLPEGVAPFPLSFSLRGERR